MRRLRIVRFSGAFLDDFLTAKPRGDALVRGVSSDAPEDLHVHAFYKHDVVNDWFEFLATSEEFEPVPEGAEIPVIDIAFTVHYEERAT